MDEHSSHYTVLARRFRPQQFHEVVGQEQVARALRNAIQSGRVAHAYLFTGARGVGKTSMARILAKSLNCPQAKDCNPCNACEICDNISAGHDVDVLEIDGASNRGIDDIRMLRANVTVKSMRTRYKVYIIDEVHMLTKEAFNALLKTLEEPPANVKFVFCTTEPNKVPDTILSRCQRFDFGTIATTTISERLAQIAVAENIEVDPEAVELVARRAAGSMRDSQSLFDQLLAFGEEHITADDVHRLLGTASDDRLIQLVAALIERRRDAALQLFSEAISEGVQLGELTDQLIAYLRDLMVLAVGADTVELSSVSNAGRSRLAEQAKSWGLNSIVAALQILSETKTRMQRSNFGRALAELGLVRIALLEDLESLLDLVQQLKSGSAEAPKASQKASQSTQKKIDQPPLKPAPSAEAPPLIATHLEFQPCNEIELWSQVVSQINDMLKGHVKCVTSAAISGPNTLELSFPKKYHHSKQYCERAETRSRLETLASQIAGKPIRVSFALAETESATEPDSNDTAPRKNRRQDIAADTFVEQAKTLFGATVVDVREIPGQIP